jgi:hypothetical protein
VLLAAGQRAGPVRRARGQADAREQRRGLGLTIRGGALGDAQRHLDVLECGELRQQVMELKDKPTRRLRKRTRASSSIAPMSASPMRTVPASNRSRPPRTCNNVLFPTPDAPTIATISPASTERARSLSTVSGPAGVR